MASAPRPTGDRQENKNFSFQQWLMTFSRLETRLTNFSRTGRAKREDTPPDPEII